MPFVPSSFLFLVAMPGASKSLKVEKRRKDLQPTRHVAGFFPCGLPERHKWASSVSACKTCVHWCVCVWVWSQSTSWSSFVSFVPPLNVSILEFSHMLLIRLAMLPDIELRTRYWFGFQIVGTPLLFAALSEHLAPRRESNSVVASTADLT